VIGRIWIAYLAELSKAARRRFTLAGPLLVVLAILLAPLAHPVARDGSGDYAFIAYAVPMALNLLGLLFLVAYGAGLVSSELGDGSICFTLLRPIRRHEYLLAKLLLAMTYATLLLLSACAASWAIVFLLGDLTGVIYGGEALFTSVEMLTSFLIGAVLALPPLFATAAFSIMISSCTRSTGAAISSAIGIWLLVDFAKYPLHLERYWFSSYLESPWRVFADRCDGLSTSWMPNAAFSIGVSFGWILIFMLVAVAALRKRDLHT